VTTPLLSVQDLSVAFTQGGRTTLAVDRVSFDIAKGETVALVGESGSGKSVTALSVMKLLPYPAASHPSGRILFKGHDLLTVGDKELRSVRGNNIGIIFQEPMTSLNPLHTIERQVGEVLTLHQGLGDAAARQRVIELLAKVGIRDVESRLGAYPHQLSGGQRQRVMIAMALANNPDLLIADEPTTALDATVQAQILALLADLRRDLGMAMMVISHDLGVIAAVCDSAQVMYGGRVVERAPVATILEAAAHPYSSALVRLVPKLEHSQHRRLRPIPGSPPIVIDDDPGCRFSPRCDRSSARCSAEAPPFERFADGHSVACWTPVVPQPDMRQPEVIS